MAGNVWEWTSSGYQYYPYDPNYGGQSDPKRMHDNRTVRGGSWILPGDWVRCASRLRSNPNIRHDGLGFRVVVSPGF